MPSGLPRIWTWRCCRPSWIRKRPPAAAPCPRLRSAPWPPSSWWRHPQAAPRARTSAFRPPTGAAGRYPRTCWLTPGTTPGCCSPWPQPSAAGSSDAPARERRPPPAPRPGARSPTRSRGLLPPSSPLQQAAGGFACRWLGPPPRPRWRRRSRQPAERSLCRSSRQRRGPHRACCARHGSTRVTGRRPARPVLHRHWWRRRRPWAGAGATSLPSVPTAPSRRSSRRQSWLAPPAPQQRPWRAEGAIRRRRLRVWRRRCSCREPAGTSEAGRPAAARGPRLTGGPRWRQSARRQPARRRRACSSETWQAGWRRRGPAR
mmetsp:Transcript_2351/g.9222  ORF Transcript_2351/g.9222 Transcript_2351/m.9222 type:complete len:317 (+) Transcript_2351:578-1528(+)